MLSHLERGSSPIDWFVVNYSFTPHIAEFFNTISNLLKLELGFPYILVKAQRGGE